MTLFSLARKNIIRNLSSYGLYFGSMVFSIVIYFTFMTLKYSDDIATLTQTDTKVDSIMGASAFVLIFFVAIFIFYSNGFFMRKRKKEVALYSLLGMRKKKIGFMLFFENLMMGILALCVGIMIGFLLSKGLLTILVQLMGYDVIANFVLSWEAVQQTALIFMVLFIITSLQGYRVIYQFQLIDLFHAAKKGEDMPRASAISAVVGIALLAFAYYLSLTNIFTSELWKLMGYVTVPLVVIALTIVGTYLLFNSVTVYLLTLLKKVRSWSWKGVNLMTVSQLLYRVRGNAKSFTMIAILSATTITAGGAVYSLYYMTGESTKEANPNTFMWIGEDVAMPTANQQYDETINFAEQRFIMEEQEIQYSVISRSMYERLAQLQQQEIVAGEYILLDPFYTEEFSPVQAGQQLTQPSSGASLTITAIVDQSVLNTYIAWQTLVVPDTEFAMYHATQTAQLYSYTDEKDQQALSQQLGAILPEEAQLTSYPRDYAAGLSAAGSLLFVGSFLGLVFLTATGSIIYFKALTEAEEDREKYAILYKIGISKRALLQTISTQVGFVFGLPLIAGLLHGAVALSAFGQIFMMDVTKPVLVWMAVYVCIYMVYYVFTVWNFYKVVKQESAT